ncbi:MAG: hypothetical protein AB4911_15555 [Oscillochloridaceae bacterium umkhey_bin13]
MTSMPTDQRDEARFQEQIAAAYRDWLGFLRAQRSLIEIQADQGRVAFEYAESREEEERSARTALAALEPTQRQLFEAVYAQERQEVQEQRLQARPAGAAARPIDPDEVGRVALEHLLREAQGIGTEHGRGLLPRGKPDEIRWYGVDVAALAAAPTAAAYAVGGDAATDRQRMLRVVGGGAVVILLALLWMVVPRGGTASVRAGLPPVLVNGVAAQPWPLTELELAGPTWDAPLRLPVVAVTTAVWPQPKSAEAQAFWREGSLHPLRLCVPGAALATATELLLPALGEHPARRLSLDALDGSVPAVLIEPCERGSAGTPLAGTLQTVLAAPDLAVGAVAQLDATQTLAVADLRVSGPGEDPALPTGQARVTVVVTAPASLDWPALRPTLLLPSGEALLPGATEATSGGAALHYLVALPTEPLMVAWSVTDRMTGVRFRWRVTLDPPPTRAVVLRAALTVRSLAAVRGPTPGSLDVQITLTNQGPTQLTLTPEDVSLLAQDRLLASADPATVRSPLAAGETRRLILTAPSQARMVLRVGMARYALSER